MSGVGPYRWDDEKAAANLATHGIDFAATEERCGAMKKKAGRPFTDADVEAVKSPPLTGKELAQFRPIREVAPEILALVRRHRGPQKRPTKRLISIRLDPDVIEHFRSRGPGWQARINATLRRAAGL